MNPTTQRVPLNTPVEINERIRRETDKRIEYYRVHPDQIDRRLSELDHEWDVERLIEVEAPSMSLMGLVLGITAGRKWLLLPLFVQSMVFMHATQGWYPLLPLFRRMGIRTEKEIARERYALKVLRGDFADVDADQPDKALEMAESD